jgi:hypothetical protein
VDRGAGLQAVVVRGESHREVVHPAGGLQEVGMGPEGVRQGGTHLAGQETGRQETGRRSAIVRQAGGRTGPPTAGRRIIGADAGIIPIIVITIILTSLIDGDRPGILSAFSCPR